MKRDEEPFMRPALLRKRCFVQMIGYEPVSVAHQHRRFIREMARFQKTWNVQSKVSPASLSADGAVANWTVDTWGPNWSVATDYYYFRWDDFVSADMRESDWWRFPLGIAALVEFILTGTVLRYFVTAWRYGCFFVLPLFYILGMLWLSIAVARNVVHHSNLAYSSFWAPPLAFAVFVVLRLTFGRLLFIRFALDDWYFARDFIHRVRPGIGDRLDRFARELVRLARETDADEIIIYGHSLGAPLSLVVVDRALELDPRLGRRGRPVHGARCLQRFVAAQGRTASRCRLAARGRRAGGECADLLGGVPGTRRHHQCLQGEPGRSAWHCANRQTDHQDYPHSVDGRGGDLQALSPQLSPYPPPGDDGQRAALFLRLLHGLLWAYPAYRAGR
jgi:hypothetical protein